MANLTRRTVVAGAVLAPFAARAQSWPSGPIRIIVPFPAGGSVDAVARLAQAGLQQRLGVSVVVENRSGASGSTGTRAGGEIAARRQHLARDLRQSRGQPGAAAELPIRQPEGSRAGEPDRHRALHGRDPSGETLQEPCGRHRGRQEGRPARSATARSAAAASGISPWCCSASRPGSSSPMSPIAAARRR